MSYTSVPNRKDLDSFCDRLWRRLYVPGNDILVLPAELVTESADGAVLAAGLKSEDTKSLGNDNALLVVVWWGNTLESLQALHGGGATGGLVGNHAPDGAPEHLGRSTVVPWTWLVLVV